MVGWGAVPIHRRRRLSRLEAKESVGCAGGTSLVITDRNRMDRTWVESMEDGEFGHWTERRHDKRVVYVDGLPLGPKEGGGLGWQDNTGSEIRKLRKESSDSAV